MPHKLAGLLLLVTVTLAAQTAAAPAYDIVSIKPNRTGSTSWGIDSNAGHFAATNVSLRSLLVDAFDIRDDLITGIPKPLASARFDLEAKIVDPDLPALRKLTPQQERSMLLPVLADRFHLKAHVESKTLPVYELIVLPGGPRFKQAAGDGAHGGMSIQNREMTATEISMTALATSLSSDLERTVIDKTGLAAHYDLTLKWSREDDPNPQPNASPTLVTALQEQLGLKLRSAKGPVQTLVVDRAELPSEN